MSDSTRDIREERRFVIVNEDLLESYHDQNQYIPAAGLSLVGVFYPDRGESICGPGQVAVSREEIDRIFAIDLPGGDNIAIALATYFEGLPDCPEDDVDDETGWSQWAMDRVSDVENLVKRHLLTSPAADQPKQDREMCSCESRSGTIGAGPREEYWRCADCNKQIRLDADQPKPCLEAKRLSYDTEIYLSEYLEMLQDDADKDDPKRSEVETGHLLHRIQQVEECIAAHEKIAGLTGDAPLVRTKDGYIGGDPAREGGEE